jgi:D-3-phosphoglycerate dehydrogenase / 2-oxoglutarate reductase
MFKVQLLNSISEQGTSLFPQERYAVDEKAENPDAFLLRSFNMHSMEFSKNVLAIARAGAGVNNIPLEKCSEQGIVVFNTPGANANAVKELVIAGLLLSSRRITQGIEWVKGLPKDDEAALQKTIEKGKGDFVGPEIKGKTLGVIGLGAIGVMVANAADSLGMDVLGYDPYISVDAAWKLSRNVRKAKSIYEILGEADYITVHVPLLEATKNTLAKPQFEVIKKGCRILNFARDGIINSCDLRAALDSGDVSCYVTDFAEKCLMDSDKVICLPHLGASTPEAEDNCAVMAVEQLKDYLENGNIVNSVNFPGCELARASEHRLAVIHKNVPNMVGQISSTLAAKDINIAEMLNRSRGEAAYTLLDVEGKVDGAVLAQLSAIAGVRRVRSL